jgi:hypothetical protein
MDAPIIPSKKISLNDYYEDDFDQQKVNSGVKELLDTCSRVIITHSKGNFYGNPRIDKRKIKQ